jgi:signal peptidase I
MYFRIFLAVLLAFGAGWLLSQAALTAPQQSLVEQAQQTVQIFDTPQDKPSPSDAITESQISVLRDRVEIDVPNVVPAVFTNTKSMDPVIDQGMTALELPVTSPDQVNVGDIVSYETPLAPGSVIIHRVVEKGTDADGVYFIFKGDNNPTTDPDKVRFDQLRRKVIGILY